MEDLENEVDGEDDNEYLSPTEGKKRDWMKWAFP